MTQLINSVWKITMSHLMAFPHSLNLSILFTRPSSIIVGRRRWHLWSTCSWIRRSRGVLTSRWIRSSRWLLTWRLWVWRLRGIRTWRLIRRLRGVLSGRIRLWRGVLLWWSMNHCCCRCRMRRGIAQCCWRCRSTCLPSCVNDSTLICSTVLLAVINSKYQHQGSQTKNYRTSSPAVCSISQCGLPVVSTKWTSSCIIFAPKWRYGEANYGYYRSNEDQQKGESNQKASIPVLWVATTTSSVVSIIDSIANLSSLLLMHIEDCARVPKSSGSSGLCILRVNTKISFRCRDIQCFSF